MNPGPRGHRYNIESPSLSSAVSESRDEPQIRYNSFWELPRLTHICGGIIVIIGLANLILILLKTDWSGLLSLFFYSIPANTAISIFPHEPAIMFSGQHFNTVAVAITAVLGNLAAGWVDYHFFTPLLQMKFSQGYRRTRIYRNTIRWFARAPFLVVAVFALTPLPFYLVKFLAFSTGYSMWRYMLAILVGRLPRFYILALLGHHLNVPTWIMVAFFSLVFAVYFYLIVKGWIRSRLSKRMQSVNPEETL
jgi:membrane protein YqaA with SNARE-associated domain